MTEIIACNYNKSPEKAAIESRDEGGGMRDESVAIYVECFLFHPSSLRPHPFVLRCLTEDGASLTLKFAKLHPEKP
jgi:hypothetical protein